MSKKAKNRDFSILAFKGHIMALSSTGEARAGLMWVDFNLVMSQEAPMRWSLNSRAAQANHAHPKDHDWARRIDLDFFV